MSEKVKLLDMYGKPIRSTLHGSHKLTSLTGALATILIYGSLMAYFGIKINTVMERSEVKII